MRVDGAVVALEALRVRAVDRFPYTDGTRHVPEKVLDHRGRDPVGDSRRVVGLGWLARRR